MLNENSLYNDNKTKTEFLSDIENITGAFLYNFVGMLGLYNTPTGKRKILPYLKKEKKVRIQNIGDTNNDMSLSLKMLSDIGMFKTTNTVNQMTRFLALLKTGKLDQIDSKIIHGYLDQLKPEFEFKVPMRLRKEYQEFRKEKKDISAMLTPLARNMRKLDSAGDFLMIAKLAPQAFKEAGVIDDSGKETNKSEDEKLRVLKLQREFNKELQYGLLWLPIAKQKEFVEAFKKKELSIPSSFTKYDHKTKFINRAFDKLNDILKDLSDSEKKDFQAMYDELYVFKQKPMGEEPKKASSGAGIPDLAFSNAVAATKAEKEATIDSNLQSAFQDFINSRRIWNIKDHNHKMYMEAFNKGKIKFPETFKPMMDDLGYTIRMFDQFGLEGVAYFKNIHTLPYLEQLLYASGIEKTWKTPEWKRTMGFEQVLYTALPKRVETILIDKQKTFKDLEPEVVADLAFAASKNRKIKDGRTVVLNMFQAELPEKFHDAFKNHPKMTKDAKWKGFLKSLEGEQSAFEDFLQRANRIDNWGRLDIPFKDEYLKYMQAFVEGKVEFPKNWSLEVTTTGYDNFILELSAQPKVLWIEDKKKVQEYIGMFNTEISPFLIEPILYAVGIVKEITIEKIPSILELLNMVKDLGVNGWVVPQDKAPLLKLLTRSGIDRVFPKPEDFFKEIGYYNTVFPSIENDNELKNHPWWKKALSEDDVLTREKSLSDFKYLEAVLKSKVSIIWSAQLTNEMKSLKDGFQRGLWDKPQLNWLEEAGKRHAKEAANVLANNRISRDVLRNNAFMVPVLKEMTLTMLLNMLEIGNKNLKSKGIPLGIIKFDNSSRKRVLNNEYLFRSFYKGLVDFSSDPTLSWMLSDFNFTGNVDASVITDKQYEDFWDRKYVDYYRELFPYVVQFILDLILKNRDSTPSRFNDPRQFIINESITSRWLSVISAIVRVPRPDEKAIRKELVAFLIKYDNPAMVLLPDWFQILKMEQAYDFKDDPNLIQYTAYEWSIKRDDVAAKFDIDPDEFSVALSANLSAKPVDSSYTWRSEFQEQMTEISKVTSVEDKKKILHNLTSPQFAENFRRYREIHWKGYGSQAKRGAFIQALMPLIFDVMKEDQGTVDRFLDSIDDKYIQNKLLENLIGKGMVAKAVQDDTIEPYAKIDEKAITAMLAYNDLDINQVLKDSGSKLRRKKGESFSSLAIRTEESVNPETVLKPLMVDEVPKSQAQLDSDTVELIESAHSKGIHGNVFLRIWKEFDVSLPTEEFEEFRKTIENSDGTIQPAFHGTGGIAATMILRYGFKIQKYTGRGGVIKQEGRAFGDGIYFTNIIDKAQQYVGNTGMTRRYGTKGYLFKVDNELGVKNRDYRGSRDRFKSPEWTVFDPRRQLKVLKCYAVELISPRTYNGLKRLNESKPMSFKTYIKEEFEEKQEQSYAIFTFRDGAVPQYNPETDSLDYVSGVEMAGNDKYAPDTENVYVEIDGRGPSVIFRGYSEEPYEGYDILSGPSMEEDFADSFLKYSRLMYQRMNEIGQPNN